MSLNAIAIPPLSKSGSDSGSDSGINPGIDSGTKPSAAAPDRYLFVGLHGWGANAQDLAGLAPYMNLSNCQLLFPDAPLPHPQVPGGRMWYGFPAGYDFRTMPNFEQQSDVQNSRRQLQDWLRSLPKQTGIPLMQTILAGFSQGGAMTLDVGLHLPLAGLVVMSGYLHAPLSLSANAPTPPVFMVHGRFDPVVPLAAAHQARDALVEAGVVVDYAEYDMGHEIQPAALAQIRSFVQGIGAKTDETT